ncbi:hypothetical protein P8452_14691 [Trifolium repens]|nr:hypothetical protein P8452_14691 [Trifolium repens]
MTTSMNGKRVEKGERGQNASSWLKDDERYFSSPSQRQERMGMINLPSIYTKGLVHAENGIWPVYRVAIVLPACGITMKLRRIMLQHVTGKQHLWQHILTSSCLQMGKTTADRLIPKGGNKKQKSKKKSQAGESSQAPQPQGSQAPTVLSQGSQAPKASQMPSQHS